MEQIVTLKAEVTMRITEPYVGWGGEESIEGFKKAFSWVAGEAVRKAFTQIDDINVSNVKVFQLE